MRIPNKIYKFIGRADHPTLNELERLIELRRQELDQPPEPPENARREVIEKKTIGKMAVQLEKVYCGKNCKGCPHGPYLYGYFWDGSRKRSIYLGKP